MTTMRYPTASCNPHMAKKDVFIVHETYGMSEDSCETLYIDADGTMWSRGSESRSQPKPIPLFQMCRICGESESLLRMRFERWKLKMEQPSAA